jgi:hypothetical protein
MRYTFILTGCIVFLSFPLYSQQEYQPTFEDTLEVYEDLFGLNEPLNLTLEFDIKQFQKTRQKEKYQPAEMTCYVSDSFQVSHKVRVRARGIYRRDNCQMPPFWLNIRYAGIEAEDLADVVKMKVVTRCNKSSIYDTYVLREYLVYKIYNLLSPYSFNVRLVRLTYVDTGRKNKVTSNWGFIIEPEEKMAERNNCMSIKSDKLSVRTVNQEIMDKVAFFSYMIGQVDYSVTGRHNLKILSPKEYGPTGFIPVPYDFDYTGLVNTSYATPGELDISSVRERYYLGSCRSEEEYQKTAEWLASYRDEITELILSFEYLSEEERMKMMDYIDSYYEESERKNFIRGRILSTCR